MSLRSLRWPRYVALAAAALLPVAGAAPAALAARPASHAKAQSTASTFTDFSLAESPGTTCPGSAQCSNYAAEPADRAELPRYERLNKDLYAAVLRAVVAGTDADL